MRYRFSQNINREQIKLDYRKNKKDYLSNSLLLSIEAAPPEGQLLKKE